MLFGPIAGDVEALMHSLNQDLGMYSKNTDVRKHEGTARNNYSDPLTVVSTVVSCSCMITRLALCFGLDSQ